MSEPRVSAEPTRALALDALRGLAILMMCLAANVPQWLPNWMYHGYYPRYLPDDRGVWSAVSDPWRFRGADWPSFTWTDWVFPMFLFAMGAAIPLALGRRLDRGVPPWRIVPGILGRGVTLTAFAVYLWQVGPTHIQSPPTALAWTFGLLGFALLFPVFTRLPKHWPTRRVLVIRLAGIAAASTLVVYLNRGDGEAFAFSQHNIIILLLAHMAVVGSIVWLLTRTRVWLRLAALAPVYLAHSRAMYPSWNGWAPLDAAAALPGNALDLRWINAVIPTRLPDGILNLSPLYDFTWYKFLFIVIPGTIIGDVLVRWMKASDTVAPDSRAPARDWSGARWLGFCAVQVYLILAVLVGLECHGRVLVSFGDGLALVTPWAAAVLAAPALALGLWLTRAPATPNARLARALYLWGALWLVLGLLAEPFEGGIKKGPPATLSYYWVSLGLSVLLLAALGACIDARGARRSFGVLIKNGQNPMLAYAGISGLLAPLVALPLLTPLLDQVAGLSVRSLDELMNTLWLHTPWSRLAWSLGKTMLLALIVYGFTRARIVWRS